MIRTLQRSSLASSAKSIDVIREEEVNFQYVNQLSNTYSMLGRRRGGCSPGAQQENDDQPLGRCFEGQRIINTTLICSIHNATNYIHFRVVSADFFYGLDRMVVYTNTEFKLITYSIILLSIFQKTKTNLCIYKSLNRKI